MAEQNIKEEVVACYHCGEPCEEELIEFDDKAFCCNGCKMVYEILDENDLCNYYDLQNSPGISLKNRDYAEKFSFLENKEIQDTLLNYSSETLNKIVFYVPSIHCSSCIWLLEHLDTLREGVINSRVNFVRKEVSIDYNPEIISLKTVVELLATVGYEPEINLQNVSEEKTRSENRSLYIQIGVAGFAFGNIMMLSFPEYFGFNGLNENIQRFMSYANVLLSLPVVFYSASNYFISAYKGLAQKYINIDVPIALGVITLFIRSLYEIFTYTGPGYLDSLSGLVFFLLIGKWIQSVTYESLSFERDYKSYFPLAVNRLIGDKKEVVQVTELQEGDLIEVRNREVIPADSILMSDEAAIDYSFVTGEAEAIHKNNGDRIFAGGRQVGHPVKLQIIKAVSQSYLTQLWNSDTFQQQSKYDTIIDTISKYFTFGVLFIASITAVYWYWVEPDNIFNSVTAVLIVACPCALALATPFTLGNAMTILGRNKFYLKHMNVIEKLWNISLMVFDKTGTLTKSTAGNVHFHGLLKQTDKNLVAAVASGSTHPLSRMIMAETYASVYHKSTSLEEIEGKGVKGVVDEHVVLLGSEQWVTGRKSNETENTTTVFLSIDDEIKGYYTFGNVYRPQVQDAINELSTFNFALLSGDNESELENLKTMFPAGTKMEFKQDPESKLKFIKKQQENNDTTVVMFGDGLNDAGALKQADVGIAVTEDVSAFTPASDAILYGGSFHHIGKFMKFARATKKIIFASFAISFIYNFIGLSFAVSANLTPLFAAILMPLSSITVVAFATFVVRGLAFKRGLL
ncbi:MAG: heavy metal translocating P-type ATPase metal-binding domain-containing protein [Bacteroidota bacterium]